MSRNRTAAALVASFLGLALSIGTTGCATSQHTASKAKAAKVATKKKSRFTKGSDNDYSLGAADEKLLKRGQDAMSASAFDSF